MKTDRGSFRIVPSSSCGVGMTLQAQAQDSEPARCPDCGAGYRLAAGVSGAARAAAARCPAHRIRDRLPAAA
jgi:hypothetical protein